MKTFWRRSSVLVLALAMITLARFAAAQSSGDSPGSGSLFDNAPTDGKSIVSVEAQFTLPKDKEPGRLFVTAKIKPGWYIYSLTQKPGGPNASKIFVKPPAGVRLTGPFRPIAAPKIKTVPEAFGDLPIETRHGSVTWYAPIELAANVDPSTMKIEGKIIVQPCDADSCLPPTDISFSAVLGEGVEVPVQSSVSNGATPSVAQFNPSQIDREEVIEAKSLWVALLFAFGGGLILNVMPCVLPVIGLKVLSFFQQAGQSRSRAFILNFWYSLGLLSVFLVLASLGVGLSEMFTAELFGIIMATIVFAMALSLMGVWEFEMPSILGTGKIQALTQDEGALGAFFKGTITTLLAIPCGAPLLSPALSWVDQQVRGGSTGSVYLVFTVIGLGMASPYLIIGAFPELLRFLPKPGAWMDTFKKAMGYCLLVAVVWILYFLPLQDGVPTVGLLFGVWLACWLVGRLPLTTPRGTKVKTWLAAVAIIAVTAVVCFPLLLRPAMQTRLNKYVDRAMQSRGIQSPVAHDTSSASKTELPWQPFNRNEFELLVSANKTVMIDFTADWCLTCKTLEALVLNTRKTRELVDRNGVVVLQADWTDRDPEVTKMLEILGGKQVPVLAIFAAGNPNRPIILRGGYTQQMLADALNRAGPSKP